MTQTDQTIEELRKVAHSNVSPVVSQAIYDAIDYIRKLDADLIRCSLFERLMARDKTIGSM